MGFAVCKPDPRQKKPTYRGWSTRSLEPDNFTESDQVGIIGGALSDGNKPGHSLVEVDLDATSAVDLADEYLPATGMSEGRAGKPRSHRYYLVSNDSVPNWAVSQAEQASAAALEQKGHPGPFKKAFDLRADGARAIDFIGTGGQVVCPPATWVSKDGKVRELREWVGGEPGEPAIVGFLDLWRAVCELASACGAAIPEVLPRPPVRSTTTRVLTDLTSRAVKYLGRTEPSISKQGGHNKLMWAARALVWGFDLGPEESLRLLADQFNPRCQPPWATSELRHKIEDADRIPFNKPRGWLRDQDRPAATVRQSNTAKVHEHVSATREAAAERERSEPQSLTPTKTWPVLDSDAMIGPAAELVRAIEPHSEADPVAILFQTLVGFGNIIGRSAFYPHEADRHYGNEFLVLVGETADGRKGTSWGHARRALEIADSEWAAERIARGLSSGEGLIHEVRDSLKDDPGVGDKRLLVMENEFANVLKNIERQGNTLSPVLRQAWEGGELRTMTKNSPARCKEPHISTIGHITPSELHRYLTATEVANGLGNRHLFACVRRSKMLPDGGTPDREMVQACGQELAYAVTAARDLKTVGRSAAARDLWHAEYPRLSSARPGLVGSMAARCLPHVSRLAMLYALLDREGEIGEQHLRAGIACWDYCEASLNYIFGRTLGDPTADQIREALRETTNGLSRTEIRDLFGRHKNTSEINRALDALNRWKMAESRSVQTGGRPVERWFSIEA